MGSSSPKRNVMKLFNTLAVCLLLPLFLSAKPVNPQLARKVAENFLRHKLPTPAALQLLSGGSAENAAETPFYIFNDVQQPVFIIVAADDRFEPVLAYSTESVFSTEQIAPGLAAWLEDTENEMQYGLDAGVAPSPEITARWTQWTQASTQTPTADNTVGPLLQSKWGQSAPYNNLCPTANGQRALVGCVATAMAQIMRYWRYPQQGNGSYSYTQSPYGTISANFGSTTYDWNAMPLQNSPGSSNTQLSRANFHCGVAVRMNYGPQFSGSYIIKLEVPTGAPCAEKALADYFRYDPTMSGRRRSDYALSTWQSMLRTDLNAGRPVLYGGISSTTGGHAFVCDGYNESMFHFNWGWNGDNNGFFLLSTMNPGSSGGFVNGQVAIFGLKPLGGSSCGTPGNLSATSITSNSASLSWSTIPGATQYYVQAKPTNSSSWTITGFVNTAGAQLSGLLANTTYQWQVRAVCGTTNGAFSALTSFTTTSSSSGPSNDQTCNATNLTVSSSCTFTSGTTVGATPSFSGSTCGTSAPRDVWFKCLIPSSGQVTIRTSAGTLNDAVMAVYWGSCSSPSYVTCEDDNNNGNGSLMPVINISGQAGTQLWIRVWGYDNASGTFRICALNYYSADFGGDTAPVFVQIPTEITPVEMDQPLLSALPEAGAPQKLAVRKAQVRSDAEQAAAVEMELAPNPANSEVMIRFPVDEQVPVQFFVFDLLGGLKETRTAQPSEAATGQILLDVANWQPGLYLVQMRVGAVLTTRRMQIIR
jgi:hypothetical protein